MTDAATMGAAADLLGGPATPAEQAVSKIAQLKADPDFVKRHLAGDHETRAELDRLHEIAYSPAQGSIAMGGPTPEAQRIEMADHLALSGDLPQPVIDQIRSGQAVSAEEYRAATARKAALLGDAGFRDRYLRGDAEARRQLTLISVILSSPIKLRA